MHPMPEHRMQRAQSTAVRLPSSTTEGLEFSVKDGGVNGLVSGVFWLTVKFLSDGFDKMLPKSRRHDRAPGFHMQRDSPKKHISWWTKNSAEAKKLADQKCYTHCSPILLPFH